MTDCKLKFPADQKVAVAKMQCLENALAIKLPTFGTDQDLVRAYMATATVIAEQVQSGKMTFIQGNAALADKWSQVVSEAQRRNAVAQSVQQTAGDWEALGNAVAAANAAFAAPQQPDIRLQTTCNRLGNMTMCN